MFLQGKYAGLFMRNRMSITNKIMAIADSPSEGIPIMRDEADQNQLAPVTKTRQHFPRSTLLSMEIEKDIENILTHRELECLSFTARGFTAKGIAKILKISDRTIETHLNNTRRKLQCCSKTGLAEMYWNYKFLKSKPFMCEK